jgi:hypothetical protein
MRLARTAAPLPRGDVISLLVPLTRSSALDHMTAAAVNRVLRGGALEPGAQLVTKWHVSSTPERHRCDTAIVTVRVFLSGLGLDIHQRYFKLSITVVVGLSFIERSWKRKRAADWAALAVSPEVAPYLLAQMAPSEA